MYKMYKIDKYLFGVLWFEHLTLVLWFDDPENVLVDRASSTTLFGGVVTLQPTGAMRLAVCFLWFGDPTSSCI